MCSVGIYYNVYRFKKHGATHNNKIIKMLTLKYYFSQITSNLYVSNWKSSYDVNNEMVRNVARVE